MRRKTFDNDKWYHPLYRRFRIIRRFVWKYAGRNCLAKKVIRKLDYKSELLKAGWVEE